MEQFTHFDENGASRMVDVSQKPVSHRTAIAEALVFLQPETIQKIQNREFAKGDVLEVARLAGIMASKRTAELIPLCHTLPLESTKVDIRVAGQTQIRIEATVGTTARTGVEMEALTAASVAALTIYDMCKSVDRGITIDTIRLLEKRGGVRGDYRRDDQS
ncbi:MAG: cyclic pyranopterin monophosphate synthase MoaC [Planctomycetaceae bacterium]|nr:cyclic pyranopterin monophosphate synthase MoaC [Planctomycetaceae bacterium]